MLGVGRKGLAFPVVSRNGADCSLSGRLLFCRRLLRRALMFVLVPLLMCTDRQKGGRQCGREGWPWQSRSVRMDVLSLAYGKTRSDGEGGRERRTVHSVPSIVTAGSGCSAGDSEYYDWSAGGFGVWAQLTIRSSTARRGRWEGMGWMARGDTIVEISSGVQCNVWSVVVSLWLQITARHPKPRQRIHALQTRRPVPCLAPCPVGVPEPAQRASGQVRKRFSLCTASSASISPASRNRAGHTHTYTHTPLSLPARPAPRHGTAQRSAAHVHTQEDWRYSGYILRREKLCCAASTCNAPAGDYNVFSGY